jgi:hypothetical protein
MLFSHCQSVENPIRRWRFMKSPLVPALFIVAAIPFLVGCDDREETPQAPRRQAGGFTQQRTTQVVEETVDEEPTSTTRTTTTQVEPTRDTRPSNPEPVQAPTNTPPPVTGNYEYGKAVPGKPGFVTSPYAPYQGYVDVRGYAPGTEVKDPYTGKIFLVPAQ